LINLVKPDGVYKSWNFADNKKLNWSPFGIVAFKKVIGKFNEFLDELAAGVG
jgi:hypothetical protein